MIIETILAAVMTLSSAEGKAVRTIDLPFPDGAAGKEALFTIGIKNTGKMVFGNPILIKQYDAAGKELPECIIDPRKTSHMRPLGKEFRISERGHFHPRAAKAAVEVRLNAI